MEQKRILKFEALENSLSATEKAMYIALQSVGIDINFVSTVEDEFPDDAGAIEGTIGAYIKSSIGAFQAVQYDGINWNEISSQLNPATVKNLYESNANTNAFTDSEKSKLSGIETGAEVNQTASEIKVAYEGNNDTNAYTDFEKAKLASIETGAEANDDNTVLTTQQEYKWFQFLLSGGNVENEDYSNLLLNNNQLIFNLTNV